MHCQSGRCIRCRTAKVRQIPSVLDSVIFQRAQRIVRIAHAVYRKRILPKLAGWSKQKLADLHRTLVITPIANPDHVLLRGHTGERLEHCCVCSFVESPDPLDVETIAVNRSQCIAKSDYSVELIRSKQPYLIRRRRCAMVRVMEQKPEPDLISKFTQEVSQFWWIPFVENYNLRFSQSLAPVLCGRRSTQILGTICVHVQIGINFRKLLQRFLTFIFMPKIVNRPAIFCLEDLNLMSALPKATQQSEQKMRVPVVPVGTDCVCEIGDSKSTRHCW